MGGLLGHPVTMMKTHQRVTDSYVIGSSCMQGWRESMEDAHVIATGFSTEIINDYFAVFDGHGGTKVADYASIYLLDALKDEITTSGKSIGESVQQGCIKFDIRMQQHPLMENDGSGSTAVLVLICDGVLYCANIGDSRAVALVRGIPTALSTDHKPNLPAERSRIQAAGGHVAYDRVNGLLAVSRSFGDFQYKQNQAKAPQEQAVTAFPDIVKKRIDEYWEFLLIACDGIWDVMSNERACAFVKQRIDAQMEPSVICELLLRECICKRSCSPEVAGTDNMTVILVVFRNSIRKPYLRMVSSATGPTIHISNQQSIGV